MKTILLSFIFFGTIFNTASAYEESPHSALSAFACVNGGVPPEGQLCIDRDFYGETLNNRPIKAKVHAVLTAGSMDRMGTFHNIVKLTVTSLEDPTKVYFTDSGLSVLARAKICQYHRDCSWREASANFVINRVFGTDRFENGGSLEIALSGNSGAEDTSYLTEVDLWVAMQQYPIIVKF